MSTLERVYCRPMTTGLKKNPPKQAYPGHLPINKPTALRLPLWAVAPGWGPGPQGAPSFMLHRQRWSRVLDFWLIRFRHQYPSLRRPPEGSWRALSSPKNVRKSQGSHAPTGLLKVSQADPVERSSKTVTGNSLREQRGGHWRISFLSNKNYICFWLSLDFQVGFLSFKGISLAFVAHV